MELEMETPETKVSCCNGIRLTLDGMALAIGNVHY